MNDDLRNRRPPGLLVDKLHDIKLDFEDILESLSENGAWQSFPRLGATTHDDIAMAATLIRGIQENCEQLRTKLNQQLSNQGFELRRPEK